MGIIFWGVAMLLPFLYFMIGLISLIVLIAIGRIWLYTRQTVELLREQNVILRRQLDFMGEPEEAQV
jgi:hypothetical protein